MSHVATVLRRTGCGGGSGCGAVTRTTALPPPLRVRGDGRRAGGRRGVPATTQQAVGGALEPRRSRVGRVGGGGVPSAARVSHRRRPRAPIELESTTRLEAEEEEEAGRTDTEVPREEAGSSGHEALQRYSAPSRSGAGGCGPLAAEEVRRVSHVVLLDLDNCMHLFSALRDNLPEDAVVRGFVGVSSGRARLQSKEILKWLEAAEGHERLDAESFAAAPVGFTAGCWPVWVTVCGGEANAADFILSMELGRLDQALPPSVPVSVVSSDQGFDEVLRCVGERPVERLDPRVRKGAGVARHFRQLRAIHSARRLAAVVSPATDSLPQGDGSWRAGAPQHHRRP